MKNVKELHNIFNLTYMGLIALWSALSWAKGQNGQDLAMYVLFDCSYYVLDTIFIICRPEITKSPKLIIFHHVVSFGGAFGVAYHFPQLRYMLVELTLVDINTWFMTLRRTLDKRNVVIECFFYISWVVIRMLYYPYLLFKVYKRAEEGTVFVVILIMVIFLNVLNCKWSFDLFKKFFVGIEDRQHHL